MAKIIKFPERHKKKIKNTEFVVLGNRIKSFINFLLESDPDADKEMWCEKFKSVLTYLGDYKLVQILDELEERDE